MQENQSKDMVILPYVKWVTETLQRFLKYNEITTALRPHQNIRITLVHLNDKVQDSRETDCIYQIPRKSCNHTSIGETGGTFGTRLEENNQTVYQGIKERANDSRE